jgi:hypothetical protein
VDSIWALRKLGIGLLGLACGLLLGLLARLFMPDNPPLPLALLTGSGALVLAVVGVVVALSIDNRYLKQRANDGSKERC